MNPHGYIPKLVDAQGEELVAHVPPGETLPGKVVGIEVVHADGSWRYVFEVDPEWEARHR